MTITKLKYGHPLALQALFASAGKPIPVRSFRDLAKLIWRQLPPSTWAILSGAVIGIALVMQYGPALLAIVWWVR